MNHLAIMGVGETPRHAELRATSAPPSAASVSPATHDSCRYYALRLGQRCRQPRSCYDCLNVRVGSEPKGCFVSPYGACESMAVYSAEMDFRANDSSRDDGDVANRNGGWWHAFPSTNTSYCEPQDAACERCREIAVNATRATSYLASTSKFCRGAGGCVCIVGCEAPTWRSRVQPDCNFTTSGSSASAPAASLPTKSGSSTSHHQVIWYLAIAQLPVFLLILFVRARWLRYRRQRKRPPSPMHRLELAGWRAMHEQQAHHDRTRPRHAETILHSALPPLAPHARPPLQTRTERTVWGVSSSSSSSSDPLRDRRDPL